jgi:hypothetical protein
MPFPRILYFYNSTSLLQFPAMTRLLGLSVLLTLARLASAQHTIVNLGYVKVQGNSNDTTG